MPSSAWKKKKEAEEIMKQLIEKHNLTMDKAYLFDSYVDVQLSFFFKQKTAYEIDVWLEFRRVLFRSLHRVGGAVHGATVPL